MFKILIVEDDSITQDIIFNILKKDNDVYKAENGKQGLELFKKITPEIIITDINMPIMNGLDMIKEIRKIDNNCKIIIATFKDDVNTLIQASELKLNKFLIKPINSNELKQVVTQSKKEYEDFKVIPLNIIKIDKNLVWNRDKYNLYLDDNLIKLTPKEKKVLSILLQKPNLGISYDEIIFDVWEDDEKIGDKNSLKTIVNGLRQKIPTLNINNIYSFGYSISI